MSSVTRHPTGSDLFCIVCHSPGPLDIDHIVNRGMGGSKERDVPTNKIALCRSCHDMKTLNRIKTWVENWERIGARAMEDDRLMYCWRKADSDVVIRVPVKVDERHGCLVACDGAEQLTAGRPESSDSASSAPSQAAGDGPAQLLIEATGGTPAPAVLMDAGGEDALRGIDEGQDGRRALPVSISPPAFSLISSEDCRLAGDWSTLDDETLQLLYEEGEHRQQEGYLLKCKAVWTYRENHIQAWGKSWTEQALERFGCSRPYAFAYANLWGIYLTLDTYLQEGMTSLTDSRSIMQAIGRMRAEDGVKLLEKAVAHVAEFAQPPSLSGLLGGAESVEREKHDCPTCGYSHWAVVEAEWKA